MDLDSLRQRTILIGNSGSGKTTLARALARFADCEHVELDRIHWQPGGFSILREESEAKRLTAEAALRERWVIEGVYGWLAQIAVPRATALIWLNFPWRECEVGILERYASREADAGALIEWARSYYSRETPTSLQGHGLIYAAFTGEKFEIANRAAANEFMQMLCA